MPTLVTESCSLDSPTFHQNCSVFSSNPNSAGEIEGTSSAPLAAANDDAAGPVDTALITGATCGVGQALAREFARQGHNLVLVSADQVNLMSLADGLEREFGIFARPVAVDITCRHAVQKVFHTVAREGLEIGILVNHVSFGPSGRFGKEATTRDIELIRTNIDTVMRLTHRFLPPMLKRRRGRILTTASLGDCSPCSHQALYFAARAFVLSISRSLAAELENTAVTVTALCPTLTDTAAPATAAVAPSPDFVAALAYEGLMQGARVVLPGEIPSGEELHSHSDR
jgi:short-subunit dehydrogenase